MISSKNPVICPMFCQVVFNIYPASEHIFLPSANIVQTDPRGTLTHILQKATPETIRPFGLEISTVQKRLLEIVESLSPKFLEEKFRPPKSKTTTPLARLLSEAATKPIVEAYIFREMDIFLTEIVQNRLPLSFDAVKKSLVKDHLVAISNDEILPHLHFKKTATGVEYRLQLGTETEKWNISQQEVLPLTNTIPAWIFSKNTLFKVPGINGNMVRPFQKKDVVAIPEKNVREYFQKIIVRSANRTSIEAEGFEMDLREKLLGTSLSISEDFLQKTWLVGLRFRYDGHDFLPREKRKQFTWVEFPEAAPFILKQVRRDPEAENERLDFLKKLGLRLENQAFLFSEKTNFETAVRWLAENRNALETAGFQLIAPENEGRKIATAVGQIDVKSERKNDWFDVFGTLRVGDFEFPFKKIVPFLRRVERYFPLPDKTFFLIPEAWFSRFSELATALVETENGWRLPKTLFTLLENHDLGEADFLPKNFTENIDFQAPASLRATLRPYQLAGVKWLIEHHFNGFGACLADDMGLGKTLQTIAVLLWAKNLAEKSSENFTDSSFENLSNSQNLTPAKTAAKKAKTGLQLDLFAAPLPHPTPSQVIENQEESPFSAPQFSSNQSSKNPFTALIILPASLIFNWRAELEKFSEGLFIYVHTGQKRHTDPQLLAAHHLVLTTYHTARNDLDLLQKIDWAYIVLDESQQIKNRDSEISKVVRTLRARHKISLSGTPIENSLSDLWSQMEFINPATLGSFAQFKKQFLLPIERHDDAVAKAGLFRRVQPFFLRRTKEEVAPELPELTEQVFFSEMKPAQKEIYERVKSAVRNQILSLFEDPKSKLLVIQALTRLRQIALHPALVTGDWLSENRLLDSQTDQPITNFPINNQPISQPSGKFDDVLAQWETIRRSGHKVLIFSFFEKYLRMFREVFEREKVPFAWLTGDTPNEERGREVARFQTDPTVQAFLMTTKAGGLGLNLQAADYVFLLDPWWNPAVESQAIARAHRIGLNHPVTAVRFIAVGTIEEKIREMQARKAKLGKALFEIGENEVPNLSREDLEMLLG